MRPATVWVEAPISTTSRSGTDVKTEDNRTLNPSSAFVHYAAAVVLRRAGKYADALQQANAAMQLAGGDARMRERASNLAESIRRASGGR